MRAVTYKGKEYQTPGNGLLYENNRPVLMHVGQGVYDTYDETKAREYIVKRKEVSDNNKAQAKEAVKTLEDHETVIKEAYYKKMASGMEKKN